MDEWTDDASDMADLLVKDLCYPEDNVTTLNHDQGPSKDGVLDALNDLVANLRKEDLLIIYYSGHGTRINNGKDFGFCTKGAYLSQSELLKSIKRVKAKVVIIVDACHSGQFNTAKSKSKAPEAFDGADLDAWFRTSGRLVMSAATARELAPGNSAFTHALIKAAKQQVEKEKRKKMCLRPMTLFDNVTVIMEDHYKKKKDKPPPPRISGVEALGSFAIGPF